MPQKWILDSTSYHIGQLLKICILKVNFPFGFIQWHNQSQQMLTTRHWIPQNPDSSMLCEVKGREFLKYIGNKTFFNLSYPFFLGHGHCSMSFWPFKSVGSTKGGGGTADIVTSVSYSVTPLLSLFMSLSKIVVQSPSKELFCWKIFKYLKRTWITRALRLYASSWKTPLIISMNFFYGIIHVAYHNKWGANLRKYVFNSKIDFLICVPDCKDTILCILILLLFDKHQFPWTVLINDLIRSSNDLQCNPQVSSQKPGNSAGIGSKSWLGEIQLWGRCCPLAIGRFFSVASLGWVLSSAVGLAAALCFQGQIHARCCWASFRLTWHNQVC